MAAIVLPVFLDAADLPRVDDRHDDRVAGPVLRGDGLAGGAAGGHEDELARADPDRVDSHHLAAGLPALGVDVPDEHELEAVHGGLLPRGHERADYFS
jgi:hypothetical protein